MARKHRDVEVIARDTVFQGTFRVDRYRLKHRTFAGGWSEELSREVFERKHAAALLPYDPVRDEVVLIGQFRAGAYAAGRDPWLIECVAGLIEGGETPEDVARRETLEESGLKLLGLERIGGIFASPGAVSEFVDIFLGRVDAAGAGGLHGLDREHEDIRVFACPVHEAIDLLSEGHILVGHTVVALQWLAIHRDDVRQRWT
ncbi:MAG: NUDIX domain-containing protein [Rhodospirillaceae bacterium]|nr:NUDIX domain-containing protein [Rhodospirillaceae bacterium]